MTDQQMLDAVNQVQAVLSAMRYQRVITASLARKAARLDGLNLADNSRLSEADREFARLRESLR